MVQAAIAGADGAHRPLIGAIVAVGLALPVERLARRWGRVALMLLALGGVGIAAGSLAGLLVSESTGLFGFMEVGYRGAIVLSVALEVSTIILLGGYLALCRGAAKAPRPPRANCHKVVTKSPHG